MWLNYGVGGCIPEVLRRWFRVDGLGLAARPARRWRGRSLVPQPQQTSTRTSVS